MITPEQYLKLLDQISNLDYQEREVIPEREPIFNVYLNTRQIEVPSEFNYLANYMDHNAETIWFALDRYFDGVDLSQKTFGLQYKNAKGVEGLLPISIHAVTTEVGIDDDNPSFMMGLPITIDLTNTPGPLEFSLRIFSADENGIDFMLHTNTVQTAIRPGLYVTDESELVNPPKDMLTELVDKIHDAYTNAEILVGDYNNIANKPMINGAVIKGGMFTNQSVAEDNNGTHINISYKDLSDLPTLNGEVISGNLVMKTETDAELADSENPIQNRPVYNKFNEVDNKFISIDGQFTTVNGNISTLGQNITNLGVEVDTLEQNTNAQIEELESDIAYILSELDGMTFVPLTINSFDNNVKLAEVGSTVEKITFDWKLGGNPTVLTLNEVNIEDLSATTTTLTGLTLIYNEPTSEIFTLHAEDRKGNTDDAETSVEFTYGEFYGASEVPAAFDSSFVSSLTKKLQTSREGKVTVNADENQYIFIAIPVAYGVPAFTVGGFTGGFVKAATIEYINEYGVAINYDIWQSSNANLGETTVTIS